MDLGLDRKVVIVTGGTSGIGEAIVHTFAQEGATVVVVGRDAAKGKIFSSELSQRGINNLFVHAELRDSKACERVITETIGRYGQIDCLVNNAGFNDGRSLDSTPEEFMDSLQSNLVHYFSMAHYCKPWLQKSHGAIINIGSKVADTGQGGTSGYAASKGGIRALTREWAVELISDGVRVNEVVPAEVWTPLYESWINTFPDPEPRKQAITKRIPFGQRFTTCQEIADAVVFMASARASHMTGQIVYVDGGYTHLDRALGVDAVPEMKEQSVLAH